MKIGIKNKKTRSYDDYIFVRLNKNLKDKIKERAENDGSNMTIWVRQQLIKILQN